MAEELQPLVANKVAAIATLGHMGEWRDYWRDVCAPKLKRRKEELGREVPEREIAAAVEAATGKPSGRGLVGHWLSGEREPFISQFFALCEKLGSNPAEILKRDKVQHVVLRKVGRANHKLIEQKRKRQS